MKFNITYYLLSKSYHQPFGWIVVAVTLLFIHIKSPKNSIINNIPPFTVKRVTATTTQLKL